MTKNQIDSWLLSGGVWGLASLQIIPEPGLSTDTAILRYLVVSDRSRGQGVGKQLEERCSEIAKRRGCGRIQLHCSERRDQAHAFYERQGYAESPKS